MSVIVEGDDPMSLKLRTEFCKVSSFLGGIPIGYVDPKQMVVIRRRSNHFVWWKGCLL